MLTDSLYEHEQTDDVLGVLAAIQAEILESPAAPQSMDLDEFDRVDALETLWVSLHSTEHASDLLTHPSCLRDWIHAHRISY